MSNINPEENTAFKLDTETYDLLRTRLKKSGESLRSSLNQLNEARKEVFGTIETKLLTTDRINTDNNCISQDMIPVGDHFIFGYNVHLGLKSQVELSDVFSIYKYYDQSFHATDLKILDDPTFKDDFDKLYKYYKDTQFLKFTRQGTTLYMIFRIGKSLTDIKAFKWIYQDNIIKYVDNRSEHEYKLPDQYEFRWKKTTRDQHKKGVHPHISIEDRLFVETIGGDLTIKVEDNTDEGKGIYSEPVENKDQTLDDSEIHYAIVGNLILLKIKPYLENNFRYLVFNSKINEVKKIDSIKYSCILLPDNQGILFPDGYYLQTGEFKNFNLQKENQVFEKRIISPNGEDFLYVFYQKDIGEYLLLPYNLIAQKIDTPIACHGFSIFDNGEMCFFRTDHQATRHHAIQIWQTPFVAANFSWPQTKESYLYKIGNKEIVRGMAEMNELLTILNKEDSYADLYHDLAKLSTTLLDSYHWINHKETFNTAAPLTEIKNTALAAIDEFEKVVEIRSKTNDQIVKVLGAADVLIKKINVKKAVNIFEYVSFLTEIRKINGDVISLKNLRFADIHKINEYETNLKNFYNQVSADCVKFLLKDDALVPYQNKVKELQHQIEATQKVVEMNALTQEADKISSELEMVVEIVSNLKIEDATHTTKIIDGISTIFASFNQIRAKIQSKKRELLLLEGKAEFEAQIKLVDQAVINYLDICDTPEKCEEYLTKLMVQLEELEGKFSEFTDYLSRLSEKREEVYNAFDSKKIYLLESRNQRANTLQQAADRILKSIKARISRFKEINEINGYFAADLMVEKLRDIVKELLLINDTVKADDVQSKLKSVREEAVSQLQDKKELYAEGENNIQFGSFKFTVNTQALALTLVNKHDKLYYHLTGTSFFEEVNNAEINALQVYWNQPLISENENVYRSEYLSFSILEEAVSVPSSSENSIISLSKLTSQELLNFVQRYMASRFNEGYIKGIHDQDTAKILSSLISIYLAAGLLRYSSTARACAMLYWNNFINPEKKILLNHQLKGAG